MKSRAQLEQVKAEDKQNYSRGLLSRGLSLWIAGFFLIFASAFGVLAFRNFPAHVVLVTILLPSVVPLLLLLLQSREDLAHAGSNGARRSAPLWGLGGGAFLLVFLLSALGRWDSYFSNFANTRFEQGGQFHKDTAFHVAIIQSIQQHGYPSTGQHESELLWYHVLSHYVDAGWTVLLGLDPWESYALLFYAKAIVLLLSLVVFASKVAGGNPYLFAVLLGVSTPALTNSWHAVGSHGQWVPFLVLLLTASWVVKTLRVERVGFGSLAGLTILGIVLSAGKISLGFSFASVVGLWLFFKKPGDWRIYLVGIIWLIYFAVWNWHSSLSTRPEVPLAERIGSSWPEILSLVVVTVAVLVLWLLTKKDDWGVFLSVLLAVGTIYVSLPLFIVKSSGSDMFYFLHGLYSIVVLIFFSMLAHSFSVTGNFHHVKRPRVEDLVPYAAFLGVVLIPLLPIIAKSPVVAGFSPKHGVQNVYSANTSTYQWPSVGEGDEGSWSVLGGIPLGNPTQLENLTFLNRIQQAVNQKLDEEGIEKSSALLFISKEDWEEIEAVYQVGRPWASGLLIKAVTGLSLVHAVPKEHPEGYGFADYSAEAHRLSSASASEANLCGFQKPVLVIENPSTTMEISVRCG